MSRSSEPLEMAWIERIFMRLHGRFGNAFLDKYRIGEMNGQGKDIGVENAKVIWSEELAGINPERIKAGLSAKYDYPPSSDEFIARCVIKAEVQNFQRLPAPLDHKANRQQAEKIIDLTQRITKPRNNHRDWAERIVKRHKNGDKDIPDIALRFAQEALNSEVAA